MEDVINEFVYQIYGITKNERKILEAVNLEIGGDK